MLIFIILFLFLSLLVSIVICKDNKECMYILFAAYFCLILAFLYLGCTNKLAISDAPVIKFLVTEGDPVDDSQPDQPSRITEDQLNEQETTESLKPLDFEDLTENIDEIVNKPAPKPINKPVKKVN